MLRAVWLFAEYIASVQSRLQFVLAVQRSAAHVADVAYIPSVSRQPEILLTLQLVSTSAWQYRRSDRDDFAIASG